jgi:hypothetical protein
MATVTTEKRNIFAQLENLQTRNGLKLIFIAKWGACGSECAFFGEKEIIFNLIA